MLPTLSCAATQLPHVLENESLSVVWYALHPKEEVTVQVVVRVENIVVCVDVICL